MGPGLGLLALGLFLEDLRVRLDSSLFNGIEAETAPEKAKLSGFAFGFSLSSLLSRFSNGSN